MPIGNSLAVIRSLHAPIIYNVSFFTNIYANNVNGLYADYNVNGLDKIWVSYITPTPVNHGIQRILTNVHLNTLVGFQGPALADNSAGGNSTPYGITRDYNGNLYIVENGTNNIKIIDSFNVENRQLAGGTGVAGYWNGASGGQFSKPKCIAVDSDNNLYVTDGNHAIRKIVYDKTKSIYSTVTTLAGPTTGPTGAVNTVTGLTDGTGSAARFNTPQGIAIDLEDNIYVADSYSHTIRKITTNGAVTTIAGLGNASGYVDGVGSVARFNTPTGICCDFDGNIYVADSLNRRVRKITKVPLTTASGTWTKLGQDIDGEAANDGFGCSVSMNSAGDRIAVGAFFNAAGGAQAGSVRIYYSDGTNWNQLGSDIDGKVGEYFGYRIAMNSVGDRIAIGGVGIVRAYALSGTNWTQLGTTLSGSAASSFGSNISMNSIGDRIVVGASQNNTNAGLVKVYSWSGSTWTQLGTSLSGSAGDRFGEGVSMNSVGDRIAIGAYANNSLGLVKVYSWDGTSWSQLGININGTGGQFGQRLSMNSIGDRIVVGAPLRNTVGGTRGGSVYVYSWDGTSWTQLGTTLIGSTNDELGSGVSINSAGDKIAIGGPIDADGYVKVYSWNGADWIQSGSNILGEAAGDSFGISVSMNSVGDKIVVGATNNDGGGANSGSVRAFGNGVAYTGYNVTTLAGAGTTNIDNEADYLTATLTLLQDITMMHDGNLLVADNGAWNVGITPTNFRRIKKIKNTTGYKDTFDITISSNRSNIVLEDLLYRRGWDGKSAVTCNLTILSGVYVYSDRKTITPNVLPATPAFSIGSALSGSTITITNSGTIIGSGGTTSLLGTSNNNNGGDGLSVKTNIVLINHGVIGGGGGAGGIGRGAAPDKKVLYAVGGGGAGFGLAFVVDPGTVDRSKYGTNGLILSGGNGGTHIYYIGTTQYSIVAGAGGNAGQDGNQAVISGNIDVTGVIPIPPTLAGKAIDGISYVTIDPSSTGSLSGATIN